MKTIRALGLSLAICGALCVVACGGAQPAAPATEPTTPAVTTPEPATQAAPATDTAALAAPAVEPTAAADTVAQ